MSAARRPIAVRPAQANDATAIERIYFDNLAAATWLPQGHVPLPFADVSRGESVHVAIDDAGDVVGFISVQTESAFVHHLHVQVSARRMGVGAVLLDSLRAWLPPPWRLKCVLENAAALAFYRTGGWITTGNGVSDEGRYLLMEWRED